MKRTLAVVFAIALVVSTVAPVALAGSASAAPPGFVTTGSSVVQQEVNPERGPPQHALEKGNGPGNSPGGGPPTHALEAMPDQAVENVMASRGSIETQWAVRSNGEPVIVATDDTDSSSGEIAIPVAAFEERGEPAPELVYGYHESGEQWREPTRVEDGYVIVEVPHFSTNTITWSGLFTIDSDSIDGATHTYQQSDVNSIGNYTIDVTGVTTEEWDNESIGSATTADSLSLNVGGNAEPTGPTTNGEPRIVMTGTQSTGDRFTPTGAGDGSVSVNGDASPSGPSGNNKPQITFTGTPPNTQTTTNSWNGVSDGGSKSFNVGGNAPGDITVTLTGNETSDSTSGGSDSILNDGNTCLSGSSGSTTKTLFTASESTTHNATYDYRLEIRDGYDSSAFTSRIEYGYYDDSAGTTSWTTIDEISTSEASTTDKTADTTYDFQQSMDANDQLKSRLYIYADSCSDTYAEANAYLQGSTISYAVPTKTVDGSVAGNSFTSSSLSNDETWTTSYSTVSTGGHSISVNTETGAPVDIDVDVTEKTAVENPNVDVDGDGTADASYTGVIPDGSSQTVELSNLNTGSQTVDIATGNGPQPDWTITYDEELYSTDPAVDVGNDGTQEVSHTGKLQPGDTAVAEVSGLTTSTSTADISVTDGAVDVELQFKERTQAVDPVVEVNGNTTSYTGTLTDGETTSLSTDTTWIREGENTVNVSVTPNANADWPTPTVHLDYRHEGQDDTLVSYTGEKFSERYNVSKTFATDQGSAEISVSFAGPVVQLRSAEKRVNGGSWTTISESNLDVSSGSATIGLGPVSANDTVDVRFVGSKANVANGEINVTDPSGVDEKLDTKIAVESNPNGDLHIGVGGMESDDRLHYTTAETWDSATKTRHTASGKQELLVPGAGSGDSFRVKTAPIQVSPVVGAAVVRPVEPTTSEPSFEVSPGENGGESVEYTFIDAQDSTSYVLYSETNDIVRDSGTANSPITLEDDDSSETLVFQVDDGTATSSGGGGGAGPIVQPPDSGIDFGSIGILVTIVIGAIGLLWVVSRRGGGVAAKVAGSSLSAGRRVTQWLTGNPRVTALLVGVVFVISVALGWIRLPSGTGILLLVSGVPLATFLILRRLDQFSPLVFGAISIVVVVIGLQLLGADPLNILLSNLGPALPIIAIGLLYILYQRVQASRAPDEVNEVTIEADGGSDDEER